MDVKQTFHSAINNSSSSSASNCSNQTTATTTSSNDNSMATQQMLNYAAAMAAAAAAANGGGNGNSANGQLSSSSNGTGLDLTTAAGLLSHPGGIEGAHQWANALGGAGSGGVHGNGAMFNNNAGGDIAAQFLTASLLGGKE